MITPLAAFSWSNCRCIANTSFSMLVNNALGEGDWAATRAPPSQWTPAPGFHAYKAPSEAPYSTDRGHSCEAPRLTRGSSWQVPWPTMEWDQFLAARRQAAAITALTCSSTAVSEPCKLCRSPTERRSAVLSHSVLFDVPFLSPLADVPCRQIFKLRTSAVQNAEGANLLARE